MITLFTGAPGGGKTYLAVHHLLTKYFDQDKETRHYRKKDGITIFSNIANLQLDHENLDDAMFETLDPEIPLTPSEKIVEATKNFWNEKKQRELMGVHGSIIYVVDEAQKYFDSRTGKLKGCRDIFFYFETHRHFGADIFLITQDRSKLAKDIQVLAEKEIRALPRSLNVMGELKYNEFVNGVRANAVPKILKPTRKVYALYQSMESKETEKIKSPLRRIVIGCLIALLLGSGALYHRFFMKEHPAPEKKESSSIASKKQKESSSISAKPAPDAGKWVLTSYLNVNGHVQIVCPEDNILMPPNKIKFPMMKQGINLYCRIPLELYQKIQEQKAEDSRSERAPARESRESSPAPAARMFSVGG